jgi:hypothetical protein
VSETTVKRPLCCGFRRTGKVMGRVSMLVGDMSRNKCFFFPGSNITCFTFYIHLWPIYWLSVVYSILASAKALNTELSERNEGTTAWCPEIRSSSIDWAQINTLFYLRTEARFQSPKCLRSILSQSLWNFQCLLHQQWRKFWGSHIDNSDEHKHFNCNSA